MKICYQDLYLIRFQSRIGCCLQGRFLDSKYILFSHSILSKYDRDFITSVDEEDSIWYEYGSFKKELDPSAIRYHHLFNVYMSYLQITISWNHLLLPILFLSFLVHTLVYQVDKSELWIMRSNWYPFFTQILWNHFLLNSRREDTFNSFNLILHPLFYISTQ